MKQLCKIATLSALVFVFGRCASQGAIWTYTWQGDPGYSGTLVLDAPSSTAGSVSDIVSLEVTTPANGTIVADTVPADGDIILSDPVFTWNVSGITEMGIEAFTSDPSSPDYLVVAQNFDGTGLNQLSGAAPTSSSPLYDDIDTGGNWVAVSVPEPVPLMYCLGYMVPLGSIAFQALRRKRA